MSKLSDPVWRRERARKAGLAARRARRRRALERASRYPDKAVAWSQGYRTGYQCAYRLWREWALRQARRAA